MLLLSQRLCVPDSLVVLLCEYEPGIEAEAAVQAAERKSPGGVLPSGPAGWPWCGFWHL